MDEKFCQTKKSDGLSIYYKSFIIYSILMFHYALTQGQSLSWLWHRHGWSNLHRQLNAYGLPQPTIEKRPSGIMPFVSTVFVPIVGCRRSDGVLRR